ncbi:MAG: VTT domain-containing protein [Anaerolineales bacterium]|nr:MAG: VTT domain-containing protein [Anaerolineales bacterium]
MAFAQPTFLRRNRRSILIAICVLLILWWTRVPVMDFLRWVVDRDAVAEYMLRYEEWAMAVYLFLLILQVIVALIPGQALVFAAGYVFGFIPTLLVTIPAAVLSSQLAFFLARRFGKPIAYRLASQRVIDRWEEMSRNQGILFYFLAFNLPIFPSDAMCYVAGLGTISGLHFLVANFLGRLVSTIFTVAISAYGFNLPAWVWAAAIAVILILYFSWVAYARKYNLKVEREN